MTVYSTQAEGDPPPISVSQASTWRPGVAGPRESALRQHPRVLNLWIRLAARVRGRGRGLMMRWGARCLAGRTVLVHTSWGGRFLCDWRDTYFLQPFAQEPFETAVLWRLMTPEDGVFLDVGANRGWYSVLAAKRGLRVIALEPDPNALALLRRNVEASGVRDQVAVYPYAATNSDSSVRFFCSRDSQLSKIAVNADEDRAALEIRCVTLRSVLEQSGISRVGVIKIDVEGAEVHVLEGLAGAAGRPIILVEVLAGNLAKYGATRQDLVRTIDTALGGYVGFYLCRRHGMVESTDDLDHSCGEARNVVFVPAERRHTVLHRLFCKVA